MHLFYHTIDAGGKTYDGPWDLRGREKEYLGSTDFGGRKVLDVGVASGGLSFYIEGQGGNVTGYDLSPEQDWDIVPFFGGSNGPAMDYDVRRQHIADLNSGLAHLISERKSSLQVVHGSVYELASRVEERYEIGVMGALLLHLRDPFEAMKQVGDVTDDKLIIALGAAPWRWHLRFMPPVFPAIQSMIPNPTTKEPDDTWWRITPEWVIRAMGVLGFPKTELTWHRQMAYGKMRRMFTVVGQR